MSMPSTAQIWLIYTSTSGCSSPGLDQAPIAQVEVVVQGRRTLKSSKLQAPSRKIIPLAPEFSIVSYFQASLSGVVEPQLDPSSLVGRMRELSCGFFVQIKFWISDTVTVIIVVACAFLDRVSEAKRHEVECNGVKWSEVNWKEM
ncbi:hypothetical protein Taro_051883 [Colocasia esculenta]|uniref:Uncharacterized protein n=1 Tax=Colocasia esculenta TaxID=4460 RepID=A0A843XID1_COLES|nr:hypothetical protein [Colocasia esculenta]